MLARILALEIAKSQLGVEEGPSNNTGTRVEEYQHSGSYYVGRGAWCVYFGLDWCWRLATGARRVEKGGTWTLVGGEMIAGGTASVSSFVEFAKQKRWIVSGKPAKGDKMTLDPGIHLTTIEKVLSIGPFLTVQTIEGNTTSYGALTRTPHNRDGVYRKRRIVKRSSVTIVRIPGQATEVDPLARAAFNRLMPKPKPKPKPAPLPEDYRVPISTLRKRTGYFAWLAWYLGEGDWKPYGRRNEMVRPHVAKKVSASRRARLLKFLAARKEKK